MELYNADTGELLCRHVPSYGKSVHPSAGNNTKFDEQGYITLPPCLWGPASQGLQLPPLLRWDSNLTSIKRNNNTYGHTGEMASWQMQAVVVNDPSAVASYHEVDGQYC